MPNMPHHPRRTLHSVCLPVLAAFACLLAIPNESEAAPAQAAGAGSKIKVLILTGMDAAHDWKSRTTALEGILKANERFVVKVETDPEFLANDQIFHADVILLNFQTPKKDYPGKASKDNLVKFVSEKGKGLFVLHWACGNFQDWPEFSNIAGLVFAPEGLNGLHDAYQPFTVKITDPDHEITKGLKPELQAQDECYYCMGHATRDYHIIATAVSKNTKQQHPMALCLQYGKGRVFNTPLGHDVRSIEMPDVAELIRRGLIWSANKP